MDYKNQLKDVIDQLNAKIEEVRELSNLPYPANPSRADWESLLSQYRLLNKQIFAYRLYKDSFPEDEYPCDFVLSKLESLVDNLTALIVLKLPTSENPPNSQPPQPTSPQ